MKKPMEELEDKQKKSPRKKKNQSEERNRQQKGKQNNKRIRPGCPDQKQKFPEEKYKKVFQM